VELNGFHVAQAGNTGLEGESSADAFADHSVRGHAVDTAGTAGSHGGSLGHIGHQLTGHEVTDDSAVAALAVMNQGESLNTLHHRDVLGDHAVGHSIQHGVAGTVGSENAAPLLRAAEVTLAEKALALFAFRNRHALAIDNHLMVAGGNTGPRHAPGSQFTGGLRSRIHEHTADVLVRTPVRTADGIDEVKIFVIAKALDHVAEGGLHAALSRFRVRALRGAEGQDNGVLAATLHSNCHAKACQTGTDHQYVGVDDFHVCLVS